MDKRKRDFETEFSMRYPDYAYLLNSMREAFGTKRIEWSDITKTGLTKWVELVRSTHSANSTATLCGKLRAFLNLYTDEENIPCRDFGKVLKIRKEPSQHVALTEEEAMRIMEYVPKSPIENDIKILAVRELMTGARGVDCQKFNEENIHGESFVFVAQKTKRTSVIPVHKGLAEYLNKKVTKEYTRASQIRVLRRICLNCGITQECKVFVGGESVTAPKYKLIGFHTLRRTFVTSFIRKGVPLPVVQHWVGHGCARTTEGYICLDMSEENKRYAGLFK